MPPMSDDELKLLVVTALKGLLNSHGLITPIPSMELLTRVITFKIPNGLFPSRPPRLRLTDLSRFESILESLSKAWEHGHISLLRENNLLVVTEITLETGATSAAVGLTPCTGSRKRKRVVDEDADSAAGGDEGSESVYDDSFGALQGNSTLNSLNRELREVYAILQRSTARGRLLAEQFRSNERFEPICSQVTKEACFKARTQAGIQPISSNALNICDRIHFRPLLRQYTDPSLGHCSYLNTCYSEPTYAQSPSIPPFPGTTHSHGHAGPNARGPTSLPSGLGAGGRGKEKAPCRYLHYEVDWDVSDGDGGSGKGKEVVKRELHRLGIGLGPSGRKSPPLPPQWINCDLRSFDYSVLGKFHVIMADPPWDIHMSLPYGTMTDDEMRAMPIPALQDEGFLFLWVTGRAMEVGRECLRFWGYTRVDEVVWVKTNQLQRVIRTGRTGHWLNHTKEHMLVGVKTIVDPITGQLKYPTWANRGLDTDVIVSEVRETSRKPDEVYGLIERMCPGGRKVEIFGRKHNTRPGWLTLGNQLGPDQIYEEDLAVRIKTRYPERLVNIPAQPHRG
ncbi:MT-A70-domain-containing protein [Pluteus cervinus]|uniref:MT-A70-domain-containing protein n=1 Tax=Pluteus cervinus TaxID=181527 RepID=A0ACD3BDQ8_9AGAR|nr:MT-A70-domain-containing protein [Pluteus cervinus]